ncbi:MAG: DNA translocase FtsK [Erysipelotrichaceae bacterium]|nr:DNA translocase FtsK [Erysipelotrichaceae bacterium]
MARQSKRVIEEKKQHKKLIWIIISLAAGTLLFFAVSKMGTAGVIMNNILSYLFGFLYFFPVASFCIYGIYLLFYHNSHPYELKFVIGLVVANVVILLLSAILRSNSETFGEYLVFAKAGFLELLKPTDFSFGGGLLGEIIYVGVVALFARSGSFVVLGVLSIISFLLLIPMSAYQDWFNNRKIALIRWKEEREQQRNQKAIDKAIAQERRRFEQSQEMEDLPQIEEDHSYQKGNIDIKADEEPIKPVVKKPNENEIYGNSKFFIHLDEAEINAKQDFNKYEDEIISPVAINEVVETKEEATSEPIMKEIAKDDNEAENEITANRQPETFQRIAAYSKYEMPKSSLLSRSKAKISKVNQVSAEVKGERIIEILKTFDIPAELIDTHIGPAVTKFEIKPDSSVKVSRIQAISDNLKMELAARDIRIEAPIPGRNAVGIEIPNVEPVPVIMHDLMAAMPEKYKDSPLVFALGKDIMGNGVYCNINKMPHLLIAGATGSGKSVCINAIISSLLMRSRPDELKLVLIDPKKVEFTPYKDVPHLLWPIITDANMASLLLQRMVVMMEERYDAFAKAGVRDIKGFNSFVVRHNETISKDETPLKKLPYYVLIIDELADLMTVAKKDVEQSIQRITQMARAAGIHMIVATQRPSVDVITGVIKSNIPSRISFAVASAIDSRTILDMAGAERLLGNGDMLYHPQGETAPIRIQGVYVTDEEVQKIADYVRKQGKPEYDDAYYELDSNRNGLSSSAPMTSEDSMYDEVVEYVKEAQKASTSLLQRRFGIGYNRAARLIDTLEENGIIGPAQGSKPREVYIKPE